MNDVDFLEFLKEKIKGKKIILFGETHGTKEIPKILNNFFSEYIVSNDFDICLELSSNEQKNIDYFFSSGNEEILKNIFCNIPENDGRRTLEYLNLIKNIYKLNKQYNRNVRIICVDVGDKILSKNFQNEREKIIANNILNNLKRKTFVILGSIHASKKIINISNIKIIPVGYYLSKKLKREFININLVPKKGKFYNFNIKNIDSSFDGYNEHYDFNYYLKCVTPATIL